MNLTANSKLADVLTPWVFGRDRPTIPSNHVRRLGCKEFWNKITDLEGWLSMLSEVELGCRNDAVTLYSHRN